MATHAPTAAPTTTAQSLSKIDLAAARKHRSLWNNAWRQFRHHKLAVGGLILFILFVLATMIGSVVYPRDKDYIDFMQSSLGPFQSWTYPLGTDTLGRDILARILWGGRISLTVGIISAMVSIGLGTLVGAIAGFLGGFWDSLLMRITDLFHLAADRPPAALDLVSLPG